MENAIPSDASGESLVARVHLTNYRNYESADVELAPGFNMVAGPNAQGKTNFLESLALLSTTRVLRGKRDHEVIRQGSSVAEVVATLAGSESTLGMRIESGVRKRAFLNGMSLPRAADLLGRLPSVSITAEDLALVRGDPGDRRLFLDLELSTYYPSYLRHFSLYKRALEQRNSLLKLARETAVAEDQFEPWEWQLAEHGAAMVGYRQDWTQELRPRASAIHAELAPGERLDLTLLTDETLETGPTFFAALGAGRRAEILRGSTALGPHRDELLLAVNQQEARLFGSQGQQRTAVIAVKLATLTLARERFGIRPLLLLDDILSDLDQHRRVHLVDTAVHYAAQTVLTCTEVAAAGERVRQISRVFQVSAGVITSE